MKVTGTPSPLLVKPGARSALRTSLAEEPVVGNVVVVVQHLHLRLEIGGGFDVDVDGGGPGANWDLGLEPEHW